MKGWDDMINHLTPKAENVLNAALQVAQELGHTYIGSEHLLIALCDVEDAIAFKNQYSYFLNSRRQRQNCTF